MVEHFAKMFSLSVTTARTAEQKNYVATRVHFVSCINVLLNNISRLS